MTANGQRREETVHETASGHENDEGDRLTTSGHDDLPGEQGNASAADVIGRGQKIATDHAETGLPESESARDVNGSDPKIATGHTATVRGRTATEKTTTSDALDCLTTNGKRSGSENDGHGHESCPIENGLHDPFLFLDPKIGKHGRIENGSGPSKHLSSHHVTERAVMSGEKQPRKQRWQGESAANEQPPEGAEETEACSLATDERPETLPPYLAGPRSSGRGGSPTGRPEEVPARGEVPGAGGTEPEGRDFLRSLYDLFIAKSSHCAGDQSIQKSHHVSSTDFTPTPSTSGVGIPVQRGQECATFSAPHPRTNL